MVRNHSNEIQMGFIIFASSKRKYFWMEKDISAYRKYIRIFWYVYGLGVVAIFLMFFMIAQGWLGFMPTFEDLENPESLLASEVVSSDGIVLGKYFYKENRSSVLYYWMLWLRPKTFGFTNIQELT